MYDVRQSLKGDTKSFTQNIYEYEVTENDVRNVTMAGLMHDLGHGPFSHLFDRGVIPALLKQKNMTKEQIGNWEHEQASV